MLLRWWLIREFRQGEILVINRRRNRTVYSIYANKRKTGQDFIIFPKFEFKEKIWKIS